MKDLFTYNNGLLLHLATLSRSNALLCLKVKSKLEEILKNNGCSLDLSQYKFVLAISGGVDSVAMFGIFTALKKKYNLDFIVAHFNHKIRLESENEKILVQELCQKFQIDFYSHEENVPEYANSHKLGLEEAGRILRYKFFAEMRQKYNYHYICKAHHAEDLEEDVLMRLLRRTSISSLGGMQEICSDRKIIRPLLEIKKEELQMFVKELALPYAFDSSNNDNQFLRNKVRNKFIPFFLQENPNFIDAVQHLHQSIEVENDFFDLQIQNFINLNCQEASIVGKKINFPVKALQNIHKALRFRIYAHIIAKKYNSFSNYNSLQRLDLAIMQNKNNFLMKFTNRLRVEISDDQIIFFTK